MHGGLAEAPDRGRALQRHPGRAPVGAAACRRHRLAARGELRRRRSSLAGGSLLLARTRRRRPPIRLSPQLPEPLPQPICEGRSGSALDMAPRRFELPEPARALFNRTIDLLDGHLSRIVPAGGQWWLGGGTALAAQWRHRVSTDLDIFLPSNRGVSALALDPRWNPDFTTAMSGLGATDIHMGSRQSPASAVSDGGPFRFGGTRQGLSRGGSGLDTRRGTAMGVPPNRGGSRRCRGDRRRRLPAARPVLRAWRSLRRRGGRWRRTGVVALPVRPGIGAGAAWPWAGGLDGRPQRQLGCLCIGGRHGGRRIVRLGSPHSQCPIPATPSMPSSAPLPAAHRTQASLGVSPAPRRPRRG